MDKKIISGANKEFKYNIFNTNSEKLIKNLDEAIAKLLKLEIMKDSLTIRQYI